MKYEFRDFNPYLVEKGFEKEPNFYLEDSDYIPLSIFIEMIGKCYITCKQANNFDGWLFEINKQLLINSNEKFIGDPVSIIFKDDKVKLIDYWKFGDNEDIFCELNVTELQKIILEWKWFVIDWEIRMIKGEIK